MTAKPQSIQTLEDAELDEALDDTFPASDPPSQTDPTHGVGSSVIEPDDEAVRQRAYEIWEKAGSPDGLHEDHWMRARTELQAERRDTKTGSSP